MIPVNPLKVVALRHRALHVAAGPTGEIVALSKEGLGSLVSPGQINPTEFELECHVGGLGLAPRLLALLEDDAISVLTLPDLAEIRRVDGAFEACLFSPSGKLLWSAFHTSGEMAALEVRETKNWQVIARAEVPDPFESSGLMLFSHPSENQVALWVAAGQDGQCLYWAHHDGSRLAMQQFPELTDTTPPGFDRSGKRFLVVSDGTVRVYQYPSGPELGRIEWQLEDDPPAETVSFLEDNHALIHSGNGRLFLIDLRSLQIVEELRICGHEPRPARELYPTLSDGDLCSDLSTFMPLTAGGFLSIHQQLPCESIADWRDELVIWKFPCA